MKPARATLLAAGRVLVTVVLVVIALEAGRWLWVYYQVEPWTRDGRVRVDVAQGAPDVPGLVTEDGVYDNEWVHKGQPLFIIDRPRYELALQQADANLAQADANVQAQIAVLAQARREDVRNRALGNLVSIETVEQGATRVAQLEASVAQLRAGVAQALSSRDTARLNLQRTTVFAPVDGVAADVELRPGDYLTTGKPAFGIVDAASLHVDGYFEETKLRNIRIGDRVTVKLMGDRRLEGHVESLGPGIDDRERSPSLGLLPNINPTFNWVRLAQRIPVRIHIDSAPRELLLIAGRTGTVVVHPSVPLPRRDRGFFWPW